jgi:hypothetical protein
VSVYAQYVAAGGLGVRPHGLDRGVHAQWVLFFFAVFKGGLVCPPPTMPLHHIAHAALCRLHSAHHSVFLTSIAVFLVLNVVENYLHYCIGRNSQAGQTSQTKPRASRGLPPVADVVRIAAVMAVFALLQGGLTWALTQRAGV